MTDFNQAVEALTARQLRTLLEAQTSLRRAAEERARTARRQLERVAEALCPEEVDRLRQNSPGGVAGLSEERLAGLVISVVRRRLNRLASTEVAGRSAADLLAEAQAEVERLKAEITSLRRRLREAEERAEKAETRAAVLERMAGRGREVEAPPDAVRSTVATPESTAVQSSQQDGRVPDDTSQEQVQIPIPLDRLPAWLQEWSQAPTWERDALALRVIGETGVARRSEAQEMFARLVGAGPRAGSVHRAFRRLQARGVMEVVEAAAGPGTKHLIRLTEKGEDAYRLLFGRDPAPSQTTELLNRHKSADHVMLILETADLLRAAGWKVNLFPEPVKLDDGTGYHPDLVAVNQEEVVYFECERQTQKSPRDRKAKWDRCYRATGGNLYIAVPDRQALDAIRSEVLYWLGDRPFRLRMLVVAEAKPEDLWAYEREQKG